MLSRLFKATASKFCLPPLAGRIFTWFLSVCVSRRLPPVCWSLHHHFGFCPGCLRFLGPNPADGHRHAASQEIYRRQRPQKASFDVGVGKSWLASCTHISQLRSRKVADVYGPALRLQPCLLEGFFHERDKGGFYWRFKIILFFFFYIFLLCFCFFISLSLSLSLSPPPQFFSTLFAPLGFFADKMESFMPSSFWHQLTRIWAQNQQTLQQRLLSCLQHRHPLGASLKIVWMV